MKLSISMTRREALFGWSYLLISTLVLPSLIGAAGYWLELSVTEHNILYFCINFISVIAIFHRFLWKSLQVVREKPWRCLRCAFQGLIIYFGCMWLLSAITPWIDPNFSNINDDAIAEMVQERTGLFALCTVLLVPVAEEVLFRGLLFQGFYRKSPLLAYCLTTVCFAVIHLIGYIGSADWTTLLLCFIQYLPAGIALANAYAASDTIATPIFMHIIINLIGVSALR